MSNVSDGPVAGGLQTLSVSVQGDGVPLTLECDGEISIATALMALGEKHGRDFRSYMVSIEDADDHVDTTALVRSLTGVRRRGRVHLHRCHQIEVAVTYNGQTHQHRFSPARTVHRVMEWAVGPTAFNVENDAADLELQIPGASSPLAPNVHVGTLVRDDHCAITLELVPKDRPQG